jgi:hypothetical protein
LHVSKTIELTLTGADRAPAKTNQMGEKINVKNNASQNEPSRVVTNCVDLEVAFRIMVGLKAGNKLLYTMHQQVLTTNAVFAFRKSFCC